MDLEKAFEKLNDIIFNDPRLEPETEYLYDYDIDEDDNMLSPCCSEILDEDIMICPRCKEHC